MHICGRDFFFLEGGDLLSNSIYQNIKIPPPNQKVINYSVYKVMFFVIGIRFKVLHEKIFRECFVNIKVKIIFIIIAIKAEYSTLKKR